MKIELQKISIRDACKDYANNKNKGVTAYGGNLDIRPKYQREFIYKPHQQQAVIKTIRKGFPLNVMYWVINDKGKYEVLDGQQRLMSICEYIEGNFSVDYQAFHNLENDEKKQILDYELFVYFCEGKDKEKLNWFETINIAGLKLKPQEIKNALYSGDWLTDAKSYFSRKNQGADNLKYGYMKGEVNRQEYLETVLKWISNGDIREYMFKHQHDKNANELWQYFQAVNTWVETIFNYREEMLGVDFGLLYNEHKGDTLDKEELEARISVLIQDEDVTSKSGIYSYVLTGKEKYLSIRKFTKNQRSEVYEKQKGLCKSCGNSFESNEMEADHIKPWSKGGKTEINNCQMLCLACHSEKTTKQARITRQS